MKMANNAKPRPADRIAERIVDDLERRFTPYPERQCIGWDHDQARRIIAASVPDEWAEQSCALDDILADVDDSVVAKTPQHSIFDELRQVIHAGKGASIRETLAAAVREITRLRRESAGEIIRAVEEMRHAQREYFRTRSSHALGLAKNAEKIVDRLLAERNAQRLF